MPSESKQLPWSPEMQTLLLQEVLEKGAHLKEGTHGINVIWKEINGDFFNIPFMIPYRETHFDS